LDSWAKDIFITIAGLLKDVESPRILSAGCGRGLIDYWLVKALGYHVTLLDLSRKCIANLERAFGEFDKSKYALRHGSVLDMPYPDGAFDLVWNEGVLEHFSEQEYHSALAEMKRVSRKFVLIDVPNAACRPYMLSKQWLEEHGMWAWGYENPRASLKKDLEMAGMRVLSERPIGNETTIRNYINMVPAEHRSAILDQITKTDCEVFPHLLAVGEVNGSIDKKRAELDYWIGLSRSLTEGCVTDAQRKEVLLRVCHEKAFPRYKESLYLEEDSLAGKRILDVGCGPHCGIIGFRSCEKYGVDHLIDDYVDIGYPLSEHGVTYFNCKSEDMPFESSFFDVVLSVNALDHVDDLEKTIKEISRVLKGGGQFVGQLNFHAHPTDTEPLCLTHESIARLCSTNHLRLNKAIYQCHVLEMKEDRYYYQFERE